MVQAALDGAAELRGVETEVIDLSRLRIEYCLADEACWMKKVPRCLVIKDDMQELYPKLVEADGIIIGTPVYYGTVSGRLKVFMDRTTGLGGARALRNKVGGAIATGGQRHGGQEFAMKTIHNFFLCHSMLIVNVMPSGYWGVAGISTFDPHSIETDRWTCGEENITTLELAKELGNRIVRLARILRTGSRNAKIG